MRLIFIAILFSTYCHGQTPMRWLTKKAGAAPPSCNYVLNTYSGAAAAYSLRKLDSTYAGSAVRVRRSSDNTEQDIGFTGCEFDTASLKSFVGANSGYVVTWYDQSGNTRDITQSTAGTQPRIVNAGTVERAGGKPSVYFNQNGLAKTSVGLASSASSIFGVFAPSSSSDAFTRTFSFCTATNDDYAVYAPFLDNNSDETTWGCYTAGGFRAGATGFTNDASTLNLFTGVNTGSAINNAKNNGTDASYSTSVGTFTINRITMGCSALIAASFTDGNMVGYISEVIFYNSDKTSDKSSINGAINTYYSIY